MAEKQDVKQGTLALMILRTLEVLGPLHGYGIARRIEETSRNRLSLNYGTLYPALVSRPRVAQVGEQPARQVLRPDGGRAEATGAGGPRMA